MTDLELDGVDAAYRIDEVLTSLLDLVMRFRRLLLPAQMRRLYLLDAVADLLD